MIGRTTLFKTTIGLVMLAACSGCSSSGDDYADGGGEVLIMPLSRDATSAGLTVDSAELAFANTSLEPCMPDAAMLNTRAFSIDLLEEPPASLGFISSVTDYCGFGVEVGPQTNMALPDLQGASALFEGSLADGTAFTLTSTLAATRDYRTDVTLDAMHLVLGVDLDAWLANVDVQNAEMSDGSVLIDAEHNPDLLAAFDEAAGSAMALYDDANGDGKLTDSELVPVATLAQP